MSYIIINMDRTQLVEMWDAAKIASQNNKEVAYVFLGHIKDTPNKGEIYGSSITTSNEVYNQFLPGLKNSPEYNDEELIKKLERWKVEFDDSVSGGVCVWETEYLHQIGRQLTEQEINDLNYNFIKRGISGKVIAGMQIEPKEMMDKYIRGIVHSHPGSGVKSSADAVFDCRILSERERLLENKKEASFYSGLIQSVPDILPFVLYFYWKYLDDIEGLGNVRKQMYIPISRLVTSYVDGDDILTTDFIRAIKTNDRAEFSKCLHEGFKKSFCYSSDRADELDIIKFNIPESVVGDLWRFKKSYNETFWELAKLRFVNGKHNEFSDGGIIAGSDDMCYSFNITGDRITPSKNVDKLFDPLIAEYFEISEDLENAELPEDTKELMDIFDFVMYASPLFPEKED